MAALLATITTALVVGALPAPVGGAAAGGDTVRIAVLSNGFHTDIALPADGSTPEALGVAADHYPVARERVRWWVVGWGSQRAYTSLVDVADLTPGLVARAIAFDRTVMHVQPAGPIPGGEGVWFLDLPRERYEALVADLAGWFASTDPMAVTQGYGDRFYAGRGRFTAWHGCNAWLGRRLRAAGVPLGLWTPTAQSIAYGLDRVAPGSQE